MKGVADNAEECLRDQRDLIEAVRYVHRMEGGFLPLKVLPLLSLSAGEEWRSQQPFENSH